MGCGKDVGETCERVGKRRGAWFKKQIKLTNFGVLRKRHQIIFARWKKSFVEEENTCKEFSYASVCVGNSIKNRKCKYLQAPNANI